MLCEKCNHWHDVGHKTHRRCTLACPLKNKKDIDPYALTVATDGCSAADEVVEEIADPKPKSKAESIDRG